MMDQEQFRLCSKYKETDQHLRAGCQKFAGIGNVKRHDKALKVTAVQWAGEKEILPERKKWWTEQWEYRNVI